eukprot:GEZU01042882.1.p1 GENE.GEZU01042882.1~~GEZU01042882.1.p1  ORF type:complete len:186 (+),score=47.19 GEZU01042882.1:71-628(+)
MRVLAYHEKKLLKKVNFMQYKNDRTPEDTKLIQRYRLKDIEELDKYKRLCHKIKKTVGKIMKVEDNSYRQSRLQIIIDKLYDLGVLRNKKYQNTWGLLWNISPEGILRRRLSVVLVRLGMADNLTIAINYIVGGQIRVGPELVTDPAFLVTRAMEDFVTWTDSSKIKRKVQEFNDKLDDFDLLGC